MAGGRTLRQVTDTHKKAQIVVAQATGVGEMELVQRLLDGELSADEFIAQSVELNKIGHEQAVRLAEQYVRQAREMMAPGIAPLPTVGVPFDYKNSLARAVSTVKAVERARQEAVRRAEAGLLGVDAGGVEKARQMLTEPGLTKAQASRLKHTLRQWTAASVQNAHRDTVIRSAQAVESGWRVVTDGRPCAFCGMLASYGEDVKGARAWPSHYFHPDCGCTIQEVPFGVDVEWTDRELELIRLREEAEERVGTADRRGMIAYMRAHGQGVVHDATIPEDKRKKVGRPKKASSGGGGKPPKVRKPSASGGEKPRMVRLDSGRTIPVLDKHTVHTPRGETATVYRVSGEYAQQMHDDLQAVYDASPIGKQVTVPSVEELRDEFTHLYVTDDGLAGCGIRKSGEIAAVYSDSDQNHVAEKLITQAVKDGGNYLECFDTYLPHTYERAGFEPVAAIPFNREFAPDGWDYDAMSQYNKGEPDILFMLPKGSGKELRRFDDWDDAEEYARS